MKFEVEVRVVLDASPGLMAVLRGLGLARALPLPGREASQGAGAEVLPSATQGGGHVAGIGTAHQAAVAEGKAIPAPASAEQPGAFKPASGEEQDRREGLPGPGTTGAPGPSPADAAGPSSQAPPPPSPAAAPAAAQRGRVFWSTPERDVVLRREIPVNRNQADILRQVVEASADVPAPATWQQVLNRAAYLGLRRPDSPQGQAAHRAQAARLAKRAAQQDTRAGVASTDARPLAEAVGRSPVMAADGGAADGSPPRPSREPPQPGGEALAVPAQASAAGRPPAPPDPPPARRVPPLPEPSPDGYIRASFAEIKAWAGFFGIRYDGGNMDVVNRRRGQMRLPELIQDEARAA